MIQRKRTLQLRIPRNTILNSRRIVKQGKMREQLTALLFAIRVGIESRELREPGAWLITPLAIQLSAATDTATARANTAAPSSAALMYSTAASAPPRRIKYVE